MTGPAVPADISRTDDEDIDILRLLGVALKGWRWLLASVLGLTAMTALVLLTVRPAYEADAMLQLDRSGRSALPIGAVDLVSAGSSNASAETEILRSRTVLGMAVSSLHLDWIVRPKQAPLIGAALSHHDLPVPTWLGASYPRKGEALELGFLQVPPDWMDKALRATVAGSGRLTIDLPDGRAISLREGEAFADTGSAFAIRIDRIAAPEGREFFVVQQSERVAVAALAQGLMATELGRQTGIISVVFTSDDPAKAERSLQAIIEAYVALSIKEGAATAKKSLDFIQSQLPEAEAKQKQAEEALSAFRNQSEVIDVSFETQRILSEDAALETSLRDMDVEETALRSRYNDAHPMVQQYLDRRNSLISRRQELAREIEALPAKQQDLVNLTRDLEMAQQSLQAMLTRIAELRVVSASEIGNVRIVDSAQAGPRPVAPNWPLMLNIAALAGLVAGTVVLLVREALKRSVEDIAQLEAMGLPALATVNRSAEQARIARSKVPALLASVKPDDMTIESLRSLRTSLHFLLLDAPTRSIVLTSAQPGDGKSFISTNLAAVCAMAGQRVCLIDADMRRGTLHRYFDIDRSRAGLADILSGQSGWRSAAIAGPIPGLTVIPSGSTPPNPSELLMRPSLPALVAELDAEFDLVLFDAPPVLAVTDPVIIGRAVGITLAVAHHLKTELGEIMAMKKALETASVPLKGAILNGFDISKASYGGAGRNAGSYYRSRYQYSYAAARRPQSLIGWLKRMGRV